MPSKSELPRKTGYFEEYRCGCVSVSEKRRKDLPGYCGKHGDQRRRVWWEITEPNGKTFGVPMTGGPAE